MIDEGIFGPILLKSLTDSHHSLALNEKLCLHCVLVYMVATLLQLVYVAPSDIVFHRMWIGGFKGQANMPYPH